MPVETYSSLPSTVLAYKREHRVGRFDPAAPETQQRKVREMWDEVERRGTLEFFFFAIGIFVQRGKERNCRSVGKKEEEEEAKLCFLTLRFSCISLYCLSPVATYIDSS